MKTVYVLLFAIAFLPSCQAPHSASGNVSGVNPLHRYNNLGDALRTFGSLQVSGTGLERMVTVRRNGGVSTQPLYVLDGFPIGTEYRRVNHLVNMQEVSSIKVLTSLSQLTTYGAQSNGGVVLIRTEEIEPDISEVADEVRVRPTRR